MNQANIMSNLRGAAGSSGIAALAQSLAQQGQWVVQDKFHHQKKPYIHYEFYRIVFLYLLYSQ